MIQLFSPYICQEAVEAAQQTLLSGWIGTGPKTAEFEKAFAKYCGAKYAVAVTSATDALNIAVKSLNLNPGDEVLTTPMTFVSTNHALLYNGLLPVFVDVNPYTLNIDLSMVERVITDKTKAIMVVHYGGNPLDIYRLYQLARKYNLEVIEDAAHACGSKFADLPIGTFGLTCFSFQAVKNLPIGDGGMVTTSSKAKYKRLCSLRWMGIDTSTYDRSQGKYKWEYEVSEVGYKCAMNDVSASIGIEQLKYLDRWNVIRRLIVNEYKSALQDKVEFLRSTPNSQSSNHLCVVKVSNRDEVVKRMAERGVELGVHYKPNYLYPMYKHVRHSLRETKEAYKQIISLPLHVNMIEDDVACVIESLLESI